MTDCLTACCSGISGERPTPSRTANPASFSGKSRNATTLVGFSPRGTGSSTQLRCTSAEKLIPASILVADGAAENIQDNLLNARLKAEACLSNPLTPYINSDATARDMDIIRRVLGDDKLNYLGISYGTWLGTWYAGLFPERVGRMVMIGNTDITAKLNDTLLSQEMGMQRVMDEILAPLRRRKSGGFQAWRLRRRSAADLPFTAGESAGCDIGSPSRDHRSIRQRPRHAVHLLCREDSARLAWHPLARNRRIAQRFARKE